MSKDCTRCRTRKAFDEFSPDPRTGDGRRSWCRVCCAAATQERRDRDPKRIAKRAEAARRLAERVKVCRGCGVERPFDEFGKLADSPDGLDARCKDCNNRYGRELYARDIERRRAISRRKSRELRSSDARREYERAWREKNRERLRENYRARFEADPTKEREKWLRRRARVLGAQVGEVDLDLLWIRQCAMCAICDQRIDLDLAWPDSMSRSVDHIIPLAKGGTHEQTNVAWTHLRCNIRKGTRLPDAVEVA